MFTGPNIATKDLVFALDATNTKSYPGSGTTWYDLTGNGHNATLVNSPTHVSGPAGHFSFDGVDQRAQQSGLPSINTATDYYTIEVWFKMPTLPTSNLDSGVATTGPVYGTAFGTAYQLFVYVASSGVSNLGVCYDDSRNASAHRTSASVAADEWVHLVHVGLPSGDGTTRGKFKYYVNGILDTDETISSDSNGYTVSTTSYVGYDSRWGVYSELDMAMIKRYSRQLNAEEVLRNFNSHKQRFGL